MGLKKLTSLKHASSFGFAFYGILLIPFLNLGVYSSILPKINVPNYITNELYKYTGGRVAAVALYVLAVLLFIRLAFVLPKMAIDSVGFSTAAKNSFRKTKGNVLRMFAAVLGAVAVGKVICGIIEATMPQGNLSKIITSIVSMIISPIIIAILTSCYFQLDVQESEDDCQIVCRIYKAKASLENKLTVINKKFMLWYRAKLEPKLDRFLPRQLKKKPYLMAVVLIAPLVTFIVSAASVPPVERISDSLIIGHRGSRQGVENTVQAIENAYNQGAEYVEIDVLLSKDNIPVLSHDLNLFRLSGKAVGIGDLTAKELQDIELNQWGYVGRTSTLDEALKVANGRGKVVVELKTHGKEAVGASVVDETIKIIKENGMEDNCVFMSSERDLIKEVRDKYPQYKTGYIIVSRVGNLTKDVLAGMDTDFMCIEEALVTKEVIQNCHDLGKGVLIWTVNEPNEMARFVDMGADGIVTDYSSELKAIVKEEKLLVNQ